MRNYNPCPKTLNFSVLPFVLSHPVSRIIYSPLQGRVVTNAAHFSRESKLNLYRDFVSSKRANWQNEQREPRARWRRFGASVLAGLFLFCFVARQLPTYIRAHARSSGAAYVRSDKQVTPEPCYRPITLTRFSLSLSLSVTHFVVIWRKYHAFFGSCRVCE